MYVILLYYIITYNERTDVREHNVTTILERGENLTTHVAVLL